MANPSDMLGNTFLATSIVGPFTVGGPTTVQLRSVDPRRIGICIIPLFGFSGLGAMLVGSVTGPASLSRSFVTPFSLNTWKWSTVLTDNGGITPNAATSGTLVVPSAGIYRAEVSIQGLSSFVPALTSVQIRQNGAPVSTTTYYNTTAGGAQLNGFGGNSFAVINGAAGDAIDLLTSDGGGNHAGPSGVVGQFTLHSMFASVGVTSPGFAFPVSQGTAPAIPASMLSQSADPFSNTWIQWPQYAPLPTYNWWYWLSGAGTYNFLIEELFLVKEPCDKPPDTNTLPIPLPTQQWQYSDNGGILTPPTIGNSSGGDNSQPPTIFLPSYPGGNTPG